MNLKSLGIFSLISLNSLSSLNSLNSPSKSCMAEEILGFGITDAFLFLPLTIPTLTTLKRRMAEEILGFVQ